MQSGVMLRPLQDVGPAGVESVCRILSATTEAALGGRA